MRMLTRACLALCLLACASPAWADTAKIGRCNDCTGAVQDNYIDAGAPDYNCGTYLGTYYGWWLTTPQKYLIRFDLSTIPATGTVTAVTYGTNCRLISEGGLTAVGIYAISSANQGWIEGTKNYAAAAAGEPDYNHKSHDATAWAGTAGLSTATTDYVNTLLGSFAGDSTGLKTATFNSDGIAYVQTKLGATSCEFLMVTTDSYDANDYALFDSSEFTTTSLRPYLEITYTIPSGSQVIVINLF